jgi:hypothetical protein
MDNKAYSARDLMEFLNLNHRPTFLYNYLQAALKDGFIEMTVPDKPRAKNQKYRLISKGIQFKDIDNSD